MRIVTTFEPSDPSYGAVALLGQASEQLFGAAATVETTPAGSARTAGALAILRERADVAVLDMASLAPSPILAYSGQPFLARTVDAARRLDLHMRPAIARVLEADLGLELLGTLPQMPRVILSRSSSWNGSLAGERIIASSPLEARGLSQVVPSNAVVASAAGDFTAMLSAGPSNFGIESLVRAVQLARNNEFVIYDVRVSYPIAAILADRRLLSRVADDDRAALADAARDIESRVWARVDRVAERVIDQARASGVRIGELTAGTGDNFARLVIASLDVNARQSVSEIAAIGTQREKQRIAGDEQIVGRYCRNLEILLVTNRELPGSARRGPDGTLAQRGDELLARAHSAPLYGVIELQVPARSFDPRTMLVECTDASGKRVTGREVDLHRVRLLSQQDFLALASQARPGFNVDSPMMIFVHGFNVNFRDAVDTVARLSVQLKNQVRPVLYSWPSAGSTWKYGDDGDMAAVSSAPLSALLEMLAGLTLRRPVHLVAHSMGNRIMLDSLNAIRKKGRPAGWEVYEELMSIAPDVECGTYGQIATDLQGSPPAARVFKRATLYLYEEDYALKWSRRYWALKDRAQVCRMGSRRGRDAAAVVGLETVDWACINEIVDTHSYYIQNDYIARDLRGIVAEHKPPRDRDLEPIDVAPSGRYFLHLSAVNRKCAGVP